MSQTVFFGSVATNGSLDKYEALAPYKCAVVEVCLRHNAKITAIRFLRAELGLSLSEAGRLYEHLAA